MLFIILYSLIGYVFMGLLAARIDRNRIIEASRVPVMRTIEETITPDYTNRSNRFSSITRWTYEEETGEFTLERHEIWDFQIKTALLWPYFLPRNYLKGSLNKALDKVDPMVAVRKQREIEKARKELEVKEREAEDYRKQLDEALDREIEKAQKELQK